MKYTQKGFIGIVVGIIVAISMVSGAVYFYTNTHYGNVYERQYATLGAKGISNLLSEYGDGYEKLFAEISKRVLDDSRDTTERVGLINILSESNTPEALEVLINFSLTTQNLDLYSTAVEKIRSMKSSRSEDQAKRMTSVSIQGWEQLSRSEKQIMNADGLYYALGSIIARSGQYEGVSFLRSEALRGGTTISTLVSNGQTPSKIAMESALIVKGRDPSVIKMLSESLKANDPTSTEFMWSGHALSSMAFMEGAKALVEWAVEAPDSCAEIAKIWFYNLKDSHSIQYIENNVSTLLTFKSKKVKDVVLASKERFAGLQSYIDLPIASHDDSNALQYEVIDYAGKYTFSEIGNQKTSKVMNYVLYVQKDTIGYQGILDIEGYLTHISMNVEPVAEDGKLKIKFISYKGIPKGSGVVHQSGDILFSLERVGVTTFSVIWNKMRPIIYKVEDLTSKTFIKTAFEVPTIKTVDFSFEQVSKNMIGKWQLLDDSNYMITFRADGTYDSEYTSVKPENKSAHGKWKLLHDLSGEDNASSYERKLPSSMYLKITEIDAKGLEYLPLYYVITKSDGKNLEYGYIGTNNIFGYKRIK